MNIKICICDDASEERAAIKTLVSYNWYIGRLASGITGFMTRAGNIRVNTGFVEKIKIFIVSKQKRLHGCKSGM